jgi:hypothetical protein
MRVFGPAMMFRNNTDTPVPDDKNNWTIPTRGDRNFFGTSNAMASLALEGAMDEVKKAGHRVRRLCTDGDYQGFQTVFEAQGILPDGEHPRPRRTSRGFLERSR